MHIYQLNHDGKISEELDGGENGSALNQSNLPSVELDGVWDR